VARLRNAGERTVEGESRDDSGVSRRVLPVATLEARRRELRYRQTRAISVVTVELEQMTPRRPRRS